MLHSHTIVSDHVDIREFPPQPPARKKHLIISNCLKIEIGVSFI